MNRHAARAGRAAGAFAVGFLLVAGLQFAWAKCGNASFVQPLTRVSSDGSVVLGDTGLLVVEDDGDSFLVEVDLFATTVVPADRAFIVISAGNEETP